MAEPKKRLTSSRSGNRKSHDALKAKTKILCTHCKQPHLPHKVCENCGWYKDKKVLILKDEKKKQKKKKEELKDE